MINKCKSPTPENIYTLRSHARPLKSVTYEHRKVFNPHWFQGSCETDNYFEGWYYKYVSADQTHCWAFIPGISLAEDDQHAFIQAINGHTGDTFYFRYPADEFSFSSSGLEICVGSSYFSDTMMVLDMEEGENFFRGEVSFENMTRYPSWLGRPGIMGWYRYMPFMECYHGVVSLNHDLKGHLNHNNEVLNFYGGRGYIEKDWGSSMPESWIWMQTNHFDQPGTSFMLSVARIPWIRDTFTGFLGFFLHQGKILAFATYTGAIIQDLHYTDKSTQLSIRGKNHLIDVHAKLPESNLPNAGIGEIKAPTMGTMNRMIHENINSEINVNITDLSGNPLFSGTGRKSGFEMIGDLTLLQL